MRLTANSLSPYVAVAEDGAPLNLLAFEIKELSESDVSDLNSSYALQIKLTRAGGGPAWKTSDGFKTRKTWGSYTLLVNAVPKAPIAVDAKWWRDVARTLAANQSIEATCTLHWEGDTEAKSTITVTLRSALTGLALTTVSACDNNGSDSGKNGFSHHQQIGITRSGGGAYAIFQWVRGVFVHWTDAGIDSLDTRRRDAYKYLLIPSGGENVPGYVPGFVHDGSRLDSAIPNFFDSTAGIGIDKPGDPKELKTWANWDRELMLMEFAVQVYLAFDLAAVPSSDQDSITDPWGTAVLGRKNYRLRNAEVSGCALPALASHSWKTGIVQIKTETGAKAHLASVTQGTLDAIPGVTIPVTIASLVSAVYKTVPAAPELVNGIGLGWPYARVKAK